MANRWRRWRRRPVLWIAGVLVVIAVAAVIIRAAAPPVTWRSTIAVASVASDRQLPVVLEDDEQSLFSSAGQRAGFLSTLRSLGVRILRISSDWSVQAPDGSSAAMPRGFNAADPADYSAARMRPLDDAVRAAVAAGIRVDLDVGFYAPLWATRSTSTASDEGANPYHVYVDATMFAAYARMLATRYGGHYRPRGASRPLPKVSLFEIWNEPNLPWDFAPQRVNGQGVSGNLYRGLVDAAYPAIRQVNPQATVLIGNTSSMNSDGGTDPIAFIEQLACVNAHLVPLHTGSCAHFTTVPASGFAHHPYSYSQEPWLQTRDPGAAQIGDLPRLQTLLDKLVAMRRLAPGAADLWLTEEGYQSNAQLPDVSRWSEAQQAEFLAISAYEAWLDPQDVTFSQFLLRDTGVDTALKAEAAGHAPEPGTWTTGLERQNGEVKPAQSMLRSPVVARPLATTGTCGALEVWGHLQPDTTTGVSVRVQFAAATGNFETVATLATGRDGVLDAALRYDAVAPSRVRLQFDYQGSTITSPAVVPVGLGAQGLPSGIPARVACPG